MQVERATLDLDLDLDRQVNNLERRLIREALERTRWNRTKAARLLGVSRNGLAMKLERLGISQGE